MPLESWYQNKLKRTVRVQRVVDEVLLDHSPAVTAVVDAARALDAALREPGVTWYRAPWGAMTDLMRACAVLDQQPDRPLPDQPGDEQPAATRQAGRTEKLLTEAARTDHPPIRALADKARALLDDLAVMVGRHAEEQRIRALVAQRRRELEEAEAKLREVTSTTRKPPSQTATIRAWAIHAGIACNPAGVLPRRVIDAYEAAHPGATP